MAVVRVNPHQQELQDAEQELQQRRLERQWIDGRITQLENDIRTLIQAASEPQDQTITLPVLCLRVLSFAPGHGVSVPKIREGLGTLGVVLHYKNPLAVLHTTLGRLEQAGYVRPVPTVEGNRTHFQITPAGMIYLQQVGG